MFNRNRRELNLSGEQMNDLERVLDDANGHELLAVVAAVHHERARQTLDDRAERLVEALDLVAPSRVRQVFGRLAFDRDVILDDDHNLMLNSDMFNL